MKISIANDHRGRSLALHICQAFSHHPSIELRYLGNQEITTSSDYPDYAYAVAQDIVHHLSTLGILICGSGLGMTISANKVPGIRAVPCHTKELAQLARSHNDANILCLGANIISFSTAIDIIHAFIETPFEGGRHLQRIQKIYHLEEHYAGLPHTLHS